MSAPAPDGRAGWPALLAVLLALPWLQPFAPGPSSSFVPLLVAWCAAGLLLALSPRWPRRAPWVFAAAAAVGAVAMLLRWPPEWVAALVSLLAIACCAAHTRNHPDAETAARTVAIGWLLAASVSSAMALLQYFGAAEGLAPWVHPTQPGESFANLRQRNQFASLTSFGLVAALWLGGHSGRHAAMRFALIALLAAGNAASGSRTGLLQWILVLGACLLWAGPQRRAWSLLAGAGLLVYVAASAALPAALNWATAVDGLNVFGRIVSDQHCGTRSLLWPNVLELIRERPWSGWGWGHLDEAHYLHLYTGTRFCDILDNAHNLPLHLAVELGVPVAFAACATVVFLVLRAAPWREAAPARRMAWLALMVLAVHSSVEYPLWYGPFQMALGLAVGMVAWRPGTPGRAAPGAQRLALVLVLAAAAGWAAEDYRRISQLYIAPEERAAGLRDDTLEKVSGSWLFRDQVRFARLTTTPVTRENAAEMLRMAEETLAFSPEPRVIEKLLECALVLRRDDLLQKHWPRFRAAFPAEAEAWLGTHAGQVRALAPGS